MAKSWVSKTTPADYDWVDVCWSPDLELFVAVANAGGDGTDRVMTSPDGTNWTLRSTTDARAWVGCMWAADHGKFVITTNNTNEIAYSSDGINWTTQTTFYSYANVAGIGYADGIDATKRVYYIRTDTTALRYSSSTDIIALNGTGTTAGGDGWCRGVWTGTYLVMVGRGGSSHTLGKYRSSLSGSSWGGSIGFYSDGTYESLNGITHNPNTGLFVASNIKNSSTRGVATFTTAWTPTWQTTPQGKWTDVIWAEGEGKFLAVDGASAGSSTYKAMESEDGTTWTGISSVPDRQWQRMAYAPTLGVIVAVANSGTGGRVMAYEGETTSGTAEVGSPLGAELILGDVTIAGFAADSTPLQAPTGIGAIPHTAYVQIDSPIGSALTLGRADFTSGVAADTYLYFCDLLTPTGTVRVPISSWQATLQTGISNYAQVVVPAVTAYVDDIEAATDLVVIRRGITESGATVIESAMAQVPLQTIRYDRGPYRHTATLSGYSDGYTESADPSTDYDRELAGVRSTSSTESGTRVRCAIDWLLQPGQRAYFDGDPLIVSRVSYYVNTDDAYMEVEGA